MINGQAEAYACAGCGKIIPWDGSDEERGTLWCCEIRECNNMFCAACFIEIHGADAYREMANACDIIRCPDCWNKRGDSDEL